MAHVAQELDLNAYYGQYMMDKMNVVPGLKTSAAFLFFLRANLVVNPSTISTPTMEPTASQVLPPQPSSPSSASTGGNPSKAVPEDLPPLTVGVLDRDADKADALKLIADSIAQQRQSTARHLIFHPCLLPVLGAAMAVAYQYSWRSQRDLGMALLLHSAVVMAYLLAIRYATAPYLQAAEDMGWSWLLSPYPPVHTHARSTSDASSSTGTSGFASEHTDTVIGVRFGNELIGTLVLRLEPNSASLSRPSSSSSATHNPAATRKRARRLSSLRGGRGIIRAWTVKLKYRGRGVGRDLLNEAVRVTRERCGRDAAVGFASAHANAVDFLPGYFDGPLRKGERRAAKALETVLVERDGGRRRRR